MAGMHRTHSLISFVATLLFAFLILPVDAEVRMGTFPCTKKPCIGFAVIGDPPEGWIEHKKLGAGLNLHHLYLPVDSALRAADARIYVYISGAGKLDEFILYSQARWLSNAPDSKFEALGNETRTNGKPNFRIYRYTKPNGETVRIVAFGEDTDAGGNAYILTIGLLAKDSRTIHALEATYRVLLRAR